VLVVGLDMAKRRHVAVAEVEGRFSKPLSVGNDWASFEALEAWARKEMARRECASLVFAMESTSHYHKPLEEWLIRRGHTVRFVSTLATSRAKEMLDGSPLKNDEKDACVVADLARQGKSLPIAQHDERYAELRHWGEFRQRLTEEKTQCLNRLHRALDLCFPELLGLFGELEGRGCRALLARAPLPDEVIALGLDALAELLRAASRGRLGRERAEQVLAAARTSVGCRRGATGLKREVGYQLRRLDELERELAAVERELVSRAEAVPCFRELVSIPQLGAVTAAVLLGELGDIRQYQHARQLIKKAGLALTERSSGQHQGKRRLSKRGRAPARHLLYLAALRMLKKGALLHGLKLNHPKKSGNALAVMGMKRLLRAIFAVAQRNEAFDAKRFGIRLADEASEKLAA
jgi:transposase